MSRTQLEKRLDADADTLLRLIGSLPRIHDGMIAAAPDALAAVSYDRERGSDEPWCDVHEREVRVCRRRNLLCLGSTLPHRSDRTGDHVVGKVLTDARTLTELGDMIHYAVERMVSIARPYLVDHDPAATKVSATVEEANRPKCQVHARYGWDADAATKRPTRLAHKGRLLLDTPLLLCRWCTDHAVDSLGKLPSRSEVDRHAKRTNLTAVVLPLTEPIDVRWDDDTGAAHVSLAG